MAFGGGAGIIGALLMIAAQSNVDLAAPLRAASSAGASSDHSEAPPREEPEKVLTQSQLDHFDAWARYVVTARVCETLGAQFAPGFPNYVDDAIRRAASAWGVGDRTIKAAFDTALNRQLQMLKVDLPTLSEEASAQELKNIRNRLERYGPVCRAAAADPTFSEFITIPEGFDASAAATAAADSMLEDGGLASWQSPIINARGDILMLAAACRHHIGMARSDELRQSYGGSDTPRERGYYLRSFDSGLVDPELQALSKVQCERAIARYRKQISALSPQ